MDQINIADLDHETITNIINDMKYKSYRYNRHISPEIHPDRYAVIFGVDTYLYEALYQKELKNGNIQS